LRETITNTSKGSYFKVIAERLAEDWARKIFIFKFLWYNMDYFTGGFEPMPVYEYEHVETPCCLGNVFDFRVDA